MTKNSSYLVKIFCHTWCNKIIYASYLNLTDLNIENACKKCLTQKKSECNIDLTNNMCEMIEWRKISLTVLRISHIFENILLDIFMYSQWHKVLILCFWKTSQVYLENVFRMYVLSGFCKSLWFGVKTCVGVLVLGLHSCTLVFPEVNIHNFSGK